MAYSYQSPAAIFFRVDRKILFSKNLTEGVSHQASQIIEPL
jgi:hypothetical protein